MRVRYERIIGIAPPIIIAMRRYLPISFKPSRFITLYPVFQNPFNVLYEIFSGEAGKAAAKSGNKSFSTAFSALRMIVTVGWAIYPLGYIFGNLSGGVDAESLNVIYNLADFINKIAFCLIIWAAAMGTSGSRK